MSGSDRLATPDSLLGMLDPDDQAVLMDAGRLRRYRRGAPIIVQGDQGDTVFLLLSGRVKVMVDTVDGREVLLAVDGPGDLLGEFEAIAGDGGPRTAGNVALEPVECRAMTGHEFRNLLETRPGITLALLRWAIGRLHASDRRRIDAASVDTTHRLARLLLELADGLGPGDRSEVDIDIPLTQEELATLVSASRDAVVRALTSLRSLRLIATARRRITILDVEALRTYAE
jgi:CRP-like cAMP-binding protein